MHKKSKQDNSINNFNNRIPVLSFFTGAGFLDMGFEKAGFEIIWTNENNPAFIKLFEKGYSSWRKSEGFIKPAKITETRSIELLNPNQISKEVFGNKYPKIWGIIGGPPCPDFSNGGKNRGFSGEKGKLTKTFIDIIDKMKPPFFIIENVSGILRIKKHKLLLYHLLNKLNVNGYNIDLKILNSLNFYLPQDRPRMFLVGITSKLLKPVFSKCKSVNDSSWFPFPKEEFSNLKSINWPKRNKFGSDIKRPKQIPESLTIYSLLASTPSPEELPNGKEYFKPHSDKFYKIDEGDTSRKSFKRLHRFRYSPTACYGNNEVHLHPWKPRRLSVREVLRIQGIPDSYVLPNDSSLTSKFKLIGNGVPLPLSFKVANSLKAFLISLKNY